MVHVVENIRKLLSLCWKCLFATYRDLYKMQDLNQKNRQRSVSNQGLLLALTQETEQMCFQYTTLFKGPCLTCFAEVTAILHSCNMKQQGGGGGVLQYGLEGDLEVGTCIEKTGWQDQENEGEASEDSH